MNEFLFYEPSATSTRFSNKERFRLQPSSQSHIPIHQVSTHIPADAAGKKGWGNVDVASQTSLASKNHAPVRQPASGRETSSSTSEAGDDFFDETQRSDSGDSLHSLFSDFSDELGNPFCENPGCDSNDGLAISLEHPRSAIISPAAPDQSNPSSASPEPDELGSSERPRPPSPLNRDLSPRRFVGISSNSAGHFKTGGNDLSTTDTVQIDKGTQTDQHSMDGNGFSSAEPRSVSLDRAEQTRVAPRAEGDPCSVASRESQEDCSFEQHGRVCGLRDVDTTNSVDLDRGASRHCQDLPKVAPTFSSCPHHTVGRSFVDEVRRSHLIPIHGFFTVHEHNGQLAYTLTFFESMADSSLRSADGETPSLWRDEAAERLSSMPNVAAVDDEDHSVFDLSLGADTRSRSPSEDGSPAQHRHVSKGQKGHRFLPKDDALMSRLRGEGVPWKTIVKFFPGRTEGSLQSHYCTKVKRKLPEDGRKQEQGRKRVRKLGRKYLNEDASRQLQCELDWVAGADCGPA